MQTGTKDAGGALSTEDTATGVMALFKAVRKHWPIVLACVILAGGVALLYSRSLAPVYEATASIEFDPKPIRPLSDNRDGVASYTTYWDNKEFFETQQKIILAERVMTAVVRDLGLQNDPSFYGAKVAPATPPTVEDLAGLLRSRVRIDAVKNTRLVLVKVEDTSPKRARRITDAVVATYMTQNVEKSVSATSDAVVWLNGQVDHFRQELESNENAIHSFKERNALPSPSLNETSNMVRVEMMAFSEALTKTRTRKQEIQARVSELTKVASTDPAALAASELLANEFLSSLRSQYLGVVRERGDLIAEGKGENHPSVRKADERLTQVKMALLAEIENIKGAAERDLAILLKQEAGELGLFENARARAVELNMKEIEFRRLDRSREQNEKLYGMLIQRMKEADLARMMNVNNVRLLDGASEPKAPIRPRIATNVAAGLLIGLLLGFALAWLRDQLDNTLKTPQDVEQRLGVMFLGLLPQVDDEVNPKKKPRSRRAKGGTGTARKLPPELAAHEDAKSGIAEAARSLRTNIMFRDPDHPHRKLLVTSAAPGEGKTTVAVSLAIALAQGGHRVCIVDCDLRRPRLHRLFDRVGDMGVTNVLLGDTAIEDVAKPTMVENLFSIPSGPTPPNAADVLHSDRFKRFIEELGERFDRVVLDSPPIVAVTDAAIISTVVDGVVFVSRAHKSSKQISRQGLRSLRDVDAPILGVVLNAVDLNSFEYNYYPQYYYYRSQNAYAAAPPVLDEDESGRSASPPN